MAPFFRNFPKTLIFVTLLGGNPVLCEKREENERACFSSYQGGKVWF